jgi:hypothetical protein
LCRERKRETGSLSGQGIVLEGPGRDQRPKGSVRGKNPVVPVAVDAGRGEDRGQPVEKFESGETERRTAGRVGLGEDVENLVRAAADEMEPFECEGRSGAIAKEALQSVAVCGLDADAGVEAKAATVLPGEHVLSLVGLQEAVAASRVAHGVGRVPP